MLSFRSAHRLTCLKNDSIFDRMVEVVVQEIDDKVF